MPRLTPLVLLFVLLATPACNQRQTRWSIDPSYRAPEPAPRPSTTAGAPPPAPGAEQKHYVFTSFRDVNPPTTHLLYSNDGIRWRTLFNDKPIMAAKPGMRDAHIARGPGGTFHMVWTNGDFGPYIPAIGYAWSRDLVTWSEPRSIPVMASVPGVESCWAPETFYMTDRKEWLVHWTSTVKGYAPKEASGGEPVGNHRIWAATTKDFRTFSKPYVLFDPGYTVIDSTIVPVRATFDNNYYLFFKDERLEPRQKAIRVAIGTSPVGPWSAPSATFTRPWSEAPSVLKLGSDWYVYFDAYSKGFYGGVRSSDLVNWRDVTDQLQFPPGHRHGTALEIDAATARQLLAASAGGRDT